MANSYPAVAPADRTSGKKKNVPQAAIILGTLIVVVVIAAAIALFSAEKRDKGAASAGFPVARLTVQSSGETETGPWQQSGAAVPKDKITVMVAASWCPYCQEHITAMGTNSSEAAKVDMVLFYEDELERALKNQFPDGQIPDEAWQQFPSKVLANPDKLEPYDLPYYLIKPGQFSDLMEGYPTFLSCDSGECRKIEAP